MEIIPSVVVSFSVIRPVLVASPHGMGIGIFCVSIDYSVRVDLGSGLSGVTGATEVTGVTGFSLLYCTGVIVASVNS